MSDREKWAFLERAPARDAADPVIQDVARSLWRVALGTGETGERARMAFAHLAHALARDCVRYETDTKRTGGEDIAGFTRRQGHTLEALERGKDDCDAKARLFVALCLAAGLRARMVPRWEGEVLRHVSAAVTIGGRELAVETILSRARLGEVAEQVPHEKGAHGWRYT
ncbi:MAG: hypothetical protein IPM35_17090 [Myxococcales bacterium]|nr:hypothetical protein [Myxococcales bacterium]